MPNIIEEVKDVNGSVLRRRVKFVCDGPSLTKQAMLAECDINGIMKRFEKTGIITHLAKREAYFADVSSVPDFATAIKVVEDAERMFMSLPAQVRKEFENDPVKYVEFCSNPANIDRMRELGIADKLEREPVVKVEVINSAPTS